MHHAPKALAAMLLALLTLAAVAEAATISNKPPNILLIYADDLGWRDLAHLGSDYYETPNLDRLAREGMVFTDAYAAAALCAPSRAALMAGQYPARLDFYGMAGVMPARADMKVIQIRGQKNYRPKDLSIAEVLRRHGYVTGIVGKWQLGEDRDTDPTARGFTFVHETANPNPPNPNSPAGPKRIDELTQAARKFITTNRDKPFFLYLSHHAVHSPLSATAEKLEKFGERARGRHHDNPIYAAVVEHLDDSVGEILELLSERGLDENTLVIFSSDNGATAFSPQKPLRGHKGNYTEGGIRVPLLFRWTGTIAPGRSSATPVNQVDIYPTLLAAAGIPPPAGRVLDGVDLLPLLTGSGELPERSLFWHFPRYHFRKSAGGTRTSLQQRPVSVVRKGDWKLTLVHENWLTHENDDHNPFLALPLYNLSTDPGELSNLAHIEKAKRTELLEELVGWLRSTNARLATMPNPSYQPASTR